LSFRYAEGLQQLSELGSHAELHPSYENARPIFPRLERYPLRESGALASIARGGGPKNRADYENAVRVMLQQDTEAVGFLRGLFGDLVAKVAPPAAAAPALAPHSAAAPAAASQ